MQSNSTRDFICSRSLRATLLWCNTQFDYYMSLTSCLCLCVWARKWDIISYPENMTSSAPQHCSCLRREKGMNISWQISQVEYWTHVSQHRAAQTVVTNTPPETPELHSPHHPPVLSSSPQPDTDTFNKLHRSFVRPTRPEKAEQCSCLRLEGRLFHGEFLFYRLLLLVLKINTFLSRGSDRADRKSTLPLGSSLFSDNLYNID